MLDNWMDLIMKKQGKSALEKTVSELLAMGPCKYYTRKSAVNKEHLLILIFLQSRIWVAKKGRMQGKQYSLQGKGTGLSRVSWRGKPSVKPRDNVPSCLISSDFPELQVFHHEIHII